MRAHCEYNNSITFTNTAPQKQQRFFCDIIRQMWERIWNAQKRWRLRNKHQRELIHLNNRDLKELGLTSKDFCGVHQSFFWEGHKQIGSKSPTFFF